MHIPTYLLALPVHGPCFTTPRIFVAKVLIVIEVKVTNDDTKYSKLELNKVMDEYHTATDQKNTFKNRKSLFWRQPYSFDFTFFATKICL